MKTKFEDCLQKMAGIAQEFDSILSNLPFKEPKQYSCAEINKWNKKINSYIEKLQDIKYYSVGLLFLPFEK